MDYDFIVGFTLFNKTGFKTRYRHFDKLDTAKLFASNVNLKDNSKIYVDLKYLEDKLKELKEIDNIDLIHFKIKEFLEENSNGK